MADEREPPLLVPNSALFATARAAFAKAHADQMAHFAAAD